MPVLATAAGTDADCLHYQAEVQHWGCTVLRNMAYVPEVAYPEHRLRATRCPVLTSTMLLYLLLPTRYAKSGTGIDYATVLPQWIAEKGGIDAIVGAMHRHALHIEVQNAGCWTVRPLPAYKLAPYCRTERCYLPTPCPVLTHRLVLSAYALATRCPALTWRMLLARTPSTGRRVAREGG
eukprot:2104123-Rhodomonas_salina.3